jgi:hypothetical protein
LRELLLHLINAKGYGFLLLLWHACLQNDCCSIVAANPSIGVRPCNNVLISSIQNQIGRFSARTEPSVRRC